MLGTESLLLRPWVRELILGPETLSSPRAGQLLKVLQDSETPGPSSAPDTPDTGAVLLVSDGTHSVRCVVTRKAIDTSDWEEKEFGFRGTEGRLLLLQDCGIRIQIAQDHAPAEFYLQVDRFNLLPTEQPRVQVTGCNQDSDVQKKLNECLEDHLSESASSSAGLTLSQLLDEVKVDQDHRGALVRLAESCLMLVGPCTTTPPLTHWTASCCQATGEAVFTVSGLLLHVSENEEQILRSTGSSQKVQETPDSLSHIPLEESGASVSLLSALAPLDPGQNSFQPPPAVCSTSPRPEAPNSPPSSSTPSCTPSFSPLSHALSPNKAHVSRARVHNVEMKALQWPIKKRQLFLRTSAKGAQEPCSMWEPPTRHRDASAFQYKYDTPSASLYAQVQAARLPSHLAAWALNLVMESESEFTQV